MASNLHRKTNRTILNVSQIEKDIRELRAENEYLKAVWENKKHLHDKEKRNSQSKAEEITESIRDVENEIEELRSHNQNLAEQVAEAASEVRELAEISTRLKEQLDEMKILQNENESLQKQLDDIRRQGTSGGGGSSSGLSSAELTRETSSNDIVEMKNRLNELIKERDNARIQFDEARKKLEDAKDNLD